MNQAYIVLAITLFMVIMFLINKYPFGVTAMACCVLLVLTGVMDVPTAFSGLSNKTTVLVAGMFAIATAFGKTSLINKIRNQMHRLKEKSGLMLIIFMYIIAIALAQVMGRTAIIAIMALFLQSLNEEDDMSPSRMIFAVLSVVAIWSGKLPIGLGATMVPMMNAQYEGILNNESLMLGNMDFFKVSILPAIVLTIYAIFAWKLIPKTQIDESKLTEVEETASISKRDETIINVVFSLVMVAFLFGRYIGNFMYIAPAVGVLILIYANALSVKEAVSSLTSDMVWMIAGVLIIADAIGVSGAGEIIGNGIISILGENPSGVFVLTVFTVASIVMTTFMSNTGTAAVLTPIAASTALVGGMDPRGIIIAVNMASILAIAFPSGSAECALAFAIGNHNPIKALRYTFPFLVLATVAIVISAGIFFPVYS